MKTKLASALFVLLLLCGTIAVSINFMPSANSDTMYQLDVYSDPSAVPIANGTGLYTDGSYVELDAVDEYIAGNTKYVFSYWDIDGSGSYADPLQWVFMNQDRNATAHYTTYYKLTFTPTPFAAYGVTDWIYSAPTGWVQTNAMWIEKNTDGYVGVKGLWSSPPGVYVDPDKWAYLVSFSGDASGYN